MELGSMSSAPRTVEEIFRDYSGRRTGIVQALYEHANETWEVNLPAEEVPPELLEPALGINFARDGMNREDWLSLVTVHSNSWFLSVAFYLGARLNHNERPRLKKKSRRRWFASATTSSGSSTS